jgi:putative flippase GtrA
LIRDFVKKEFVRYLIGGVANTLFGYLSFVLLVEFFSAEVHYLLLLVANFFISVTFAFFVLKKFVFRSEGSFASELLKNYLVYGLALAANAVLLAILVEIASLSLIVGQGFCVVITPLITYFVHRHYTFVKSK